MNRRGSHRIKRRIPCEFEYEGHSYAGIVVDLSQEGLFLQTDTAIDPGSELSLRLRPERLPAMTLRGRVVRRRFTPAVLASMIRRGVGIRILDAPAAYYEMLGVEPVEAPDRVWGAVDDWEPLEDDAASSGPVTIDIQIGAEEDPEASAAATAEADPWSFAAGEAAPVDEQKLDVELEEPWEALPSDLVPPTPEWMPQTLHRADALLIDEGELDDVQALLESLGADLLRQRSADTHGFQGWEKPPRLLIAAARSALRLSVGPKAEPQGIVTMAIVDSRSQTLCGMLRRQGFRYVVRRPVHPEAMRLLMLRALYRGRERREAPRVPFGCQISLRLNLLRKPATLLELSRNGARVLTREWLDPGDALRLRIGPEITGRRSLSLAGRVIRSERRRAVDPEQRVALALRFDRLGDVQRDRLEALVVAHAWGPPSLGRPSAARPPQAREARRAEGKPAAPAATQAPLVERRLAPRGRHREEVLALDPELRRVRHALLGVDLSRSGLRVEPHPELALGDRMKLAIHDAACEASLVVTAEVARDDGAQGLLLRFDALDDAAARALDTILERAPQLETRYGASGRGLVVAEVLGSPDA